MQYKIKCNDYDSMGLLFDAMTLNTNYHIQQFCDADKCYYLIVSVKESI